MMEAEERKSLERRRIEAKGRCHQLTTRINELRCMIEDVIGTYNKWNKIFENADLKLAEEDKLQVIENGKGKKGLAKTSDVQLLVTMNREQIEKIAEALGVEI